MSENTRLTPNLLIQPMHRLRRPVWGSVRFSPTLPFKILISISLHLILSVEKIDFLKPLTDVNLERVGDKAVFECEISKPGLRPEWFFEGQPISKGLK